MRTRGLVRGSHLRAAAMGAGVMALLVVAGCGGGGDSPKAPVQPSTTGKMVLTINWPQAADSVAPAAIPSQAQCVNVKLSNDLGWSTEVTAARPTGTTTSTITILNVPVGNVHIHFGAYSACQGGVGSAVVPAGDLLAWAVTDVYVPPNQAVEVGFTLSDVPDHLHINVGCPTTNLVVGQECQLSATGFDSDGNILLIPEPEWTSDNEGVATVDASGKVTAQGPGTCMIRATVSGVFDEVQFTVAVPPTVALSADKTSIVNGDNVTLTWASTNATSVVSSNFGATTASGQMVLSPAATTIFTITVSGPGGQATDTVTVEVSEAPDVTSVSISADKTTLMQGETTTLRWSSTNATGVVSSNFDTGSISGERGISPQVTTTYTITVTGPGGEATDSVTVTVASQTAVSLTADPLVVVPGQETTLTWSSAGADAVVSSNFDAGSVSGQKAVQTWQTTTYTITVSGPGGEASASVTVEVTRLTTVNITATPRSIIGGQSTTLRWHSTNATSVDSSNFGATSVNGTMTVSPTVTTIYEIAVSGPGGSSTDKVTINVIPVPTVTLTADPTAFVGAGQSTLTWSSTDADSVVSSDFGANVVNGQMTVSPTNTRTYNITVQGPGGQASASATVTVVPPVTLTLEADPNPIFAGQSTTLTWFSSNGTAVTASNFASLPLALSGNRTVTPAASTQYSITVSGPLNQLVTRTVNVIVLQPGVNITAAPQSILPGYGTLLEWSSSNASEVTDSNFGVPATMLNGQTIAFPKGNQNFWLTVLGPGGVDATDNVTVTLDSTSPAPSLVLSSNPDNTMFFQQGANAVFSWASTNATAVVGYSAKVMWNGGASEVPVNEFQPTSVNGQMNFFPSIAWWQTQQGMSNPPGLPWVCRFEMYVRGPGGIVGHNVDLQIEQMPAIIGN